MQKILNSTFKLLIAATFLINPLQACRPATEALELLSSPTRPIASPLIKNSILLEKPHHTLSRINQSSPLSHHPSWLSSSKRLKGPFGQVPLKTSAPFQEHPKCQGFMFTRPYSTEEHHEASSQIDEDLQYAGLSIDGGGVKGLVYARVLAEIERRLQDTLREQNKGNFTPIHLHEAFDYIGGTSVGGALALALVTPQSPHNRTPYPLEWWIDNFSNNTRSILPNTYYNFFRQFWGVRYPDADYQHLLNQWFKDVALKDVLKDVVVTSTQFESREPFIFTKEEATAADHNFYLRDVVRATTSVFSQYQPARIKSISGREVPALLDGSICFNNTSQFVYNRIQKKTGATRKNIFMVSVGSDITARDTQHNTGLIWLAPYQINHFMSGSSDGVQSELSGLLRDNYIRLKPEPSINIISYNDTSPDVAKKLDEAAKSIISSQNTKITTIAQKLAHIMGKRQFSTLAKRPLKDADPSCKYNVLSIDGGGIRGIIPCLILKQIEEVTGKRAYELFDYIGGTSTGALLALGLTVPHPQDSKQARFTASDLTNLFQSEERYLVFSPYWKVPFWKKAAISARQVFRTAYSATKYERLLRQKFKNVFIEEALTNILAACTKFNNKNMIVFTKHGREQGADVLPGHYLMREIARATSAAPSYFLPGEVTEPDSEENDANKYFYVDGGICCNNPAQLVWNRTQREFEDATISNTYVVSLGTGYHSKRPWYAPTEKSGFLRWIPSLHNYFMEGNSFSVHHEMSNLLNENYIRLQPDLKKSIDLAGVDEKNLLLLKEAAESIIKDTNIVDKISYRLLKNKGLSIPADLAKRI